MRFKKSTYLLVTYCLVVLRVIYVVGRHGWSRCVDLYGKTSCQRRSEWLPHNWSVSGLAAPISWSSGAVLSWSQSRKHWSAQEQASESRTAGSRACSARYTWCTSSQPRRGRDYDLASPYLPRGLWRQMGHPCPPWSISHERQFVDNTRGFYAVLQHYTASPY